MRASTIPTTVAWFVAVLVVTSAAGCTSRPAGPGSGGPRQERTASVTSPQAPVPGPTTAGVTAVHVTIGNTTITGELSDNPAARDLATRLPLTLTFGHYNGVEMTSRLEEPLTRAGMPAGDDPNPGEIGWYAPSSDLVLYYGDVGYWNGIVRLGTFDASGIALLADSTTDLTVTIASDDE